MEVWQTNTYGRYTHPSDPNPAPLDLNFEGSAVLTTDAEGRYRSKTIKPPAASGLPLLDLRHSGCDERAAVIDR
jgi:protocatechuate 3,4-dioxygenase beta subunit